MDVPAMHGKFTYTLSQNEGVASDDLKSNGKMEREVQRDGTSPEAVLFDTGDDQKAAVSFVLSDPTKYTQLSGLGQSRHAWDTYVCVVYALIVVLFGTAFPLTEALQGSWMQSSVASIFMGYMYVVAIGFLIYLQVEMCLTARAIERQKLASGGKVHTDSHEHGPVNTETANGTELRQRVTPSAGKYDQHGVRTDRHFVRQLDGEDVGDKRAMLTHLHDFTSMSVHHEGTSAYLRVGFLVFSIGNAVLLIMELVVYSNQFEYDCPTQRFLSAKYWQLIFLVVQTLFVLINHKIVIRRHRGFVLFGLIHVLANNLCIWVRTLTEEVWHEYLTLAAKKSYDSYDKYANSSSYDNYSTSAPHVSRKLLAASADDPCSSQLLSDVQPYLFPFILEYSLIAVAIFAIMYRSLTIRVSEAITHSMQRCFAKCADQDYDAHEEHEQKGCLARSVWGFCLGLAVAVATISSISMYFYYAEALADHFTASLIVTVTSTFIHIFLIIAVIQALVRLRHFQFTVSRDNSIDDILLLISLGGMILMGIFELIRTIGTFKGLEGPVEAPQRTLNTFLNVMVVLEVTQAILQTCFVMHGLQRYPANREQQRDKPGRNAITFLVIVNVTLWVFKSTLMKDILLEKTLEMFGAIAGPLIININLPLALYFRFHSSVCLAEMRTCVYEPVFHH